MPDGERPVAPGAAFRRIGIVGAGGWGTALAVLLAGARRPVRIWSHNPEVAAEMAVERTNATYLPGVRIPEDVAPTTELEELVDSELLVVVPPSRAMREVMVRLVAAGLRAGTALLSCTKGIELDTGLLMSGVIRECAPANPVAVLSGPNLAPEIARGNPAAAVIGAGDPEIAGALQAVFSLPGFRAYTSDDVAGIQLGGALKNVFAIAAGAIDGFAMGDNTKAALVTRALAEMMRLGVALGGRRETFHGLSGVGDLMVTCFSGRSRNRTFGERLGRGESRGVIESSMKMIAEGVPTARAVRQCAERLGIDAPITAEVYAVLYENKAPRDAMLELLDRPPKPEADEARGCASPRR